VSTSGWKFEDFALSEFQPVIYGHTLFPLDDDVVGEGRSTRTVPTSGGEAEVGTARGPRPRRWESLRGFLFLPILSDPMPDRGLEPGAGNGKMVGALLDEDGGASLVSQGASGER